MPAEGTIQFAEALRLDGPRSFALMIKPAGALCNMGCRYCYYLKNAVSGGRMSQSILEHVVRSYLDAVETNEAHFIWHGGEPLLMGLDFYLAAIEYQKRYGRGKIIHNVVQTNGSLIDKNWAELFSKNNFLVGLSLDGPRDLHDLYRKDRSGAPTFDKVMGALNMLIEKEVAFNTLTTVNRASEGRGAEVYEFLKASGSRYMQFLPVADRTQWSVSAEGFGRFMCDVFDCWKLGDVGRLFVTLFDASLAAWCGLPGGICIYGQSCSGSAVVEYNGDVYLCDHFVSPEHKLGNILETPFRELLTWEKTRHFSTLKWAKLPERCHKCPYLQACNGECPGHRDPSTGINDLCEGYRIFFRHAAPHLAHFRELLSKSCSPSP